MIGGGRCRIDMNYNNAYWLLRLRLKPGAWADQQYSVGHDFQKKNQLQQCTVQCQCDYNVGIRVLQQCVKPSIPETLLLRTFTTTGFHSWENPACITLLGVRSFNFMT